MWKDYDAETVLASVILPYYNYFASTGAFKKN